MLCRSWRVLILCLAITGLVFSQGLDTVASKDDWEEINFEFDSSILTDGFPSLLRMAELLNQNPEYKVKLTGHADYLGSSQYNERLALNRSDAVKAFLEKYGARPGQISSAGEGEARPKINAQSKEARFMNRRVEMMVSDADGKLIGSGGVGDAIKALESLAQKQEECCNAILKKLDKLDEILQAINDLKNENKQLRDDIDALKDDQGGLKEEVAEIAKLPPPPSQEQITKVVEQAVEKSKSDRFKHFSLLGINLGTDNSGDLTWSGKGRYFRPFMDNFAIQAEAEYLGWSGRKEGQFDIGLVGRYQQFQVGLFSSFKHISLSEYDEGGTLGQASITADYLFGRGKIGIFGSKGFMEKDLIQARKISANVFENTYLRTVDQIGVSGSVALWKRNWLEGNIGYLAARQSSSKPGGTIRLVMPFREHWAFTAEGGVNETLISADTYGRWAVGVRFGNFLGPNQYAEVKHPVPVDIPRVRWEIVTERVRTGNDPPNADAGPDLIGVPPGQITLDGSGSSDPDGDEITFQWVQISGPTVSITDADKAVARFGAEDGKVYAFRLTVTDALRASSTDSVSVTTKETPQPRIMQFTATPNSIRRGETATLAWQVENADEVEIDNGVGSVDKVSGTVDVMPADTTVYSITARNDVGEVTLSVLVSVNTPAPTFIRCDVTPQNIVWGESATISWQLEDADQVSLTGFGNVPTTGSQVVSPTGNTTYTLNASNGFGSTSCPLTVQVTAGEVPRINRFGANPLRILAGTSTTLDWEVDNADEVTIDNGVGQVADTTGAVVVSPMQTVAYTLTATNRFGSVSVNIVIVVVQQAAVISFTATPASLDNPGDAVLISWDTDNATAVNITGLGPRPPTGSVLVRLLTTTSYTLVATNQLSEATATLTIPVGTGGGAP